MSSPEINRTTEVERTAAVHKHKIVGGLITQEKDSIDIQVNTEQVKVRPGWQKQVMRAQQRIITEGEGQVDTEQQTQTEGVSKDLDIRSRSLSHNTTDSHSDEPETPTSEEIHLLYNYIEANDLSDTLDKLPDPDTYIFKPSARFQDTKPHGYHSQYDGHVNPAMLFLGGDTHSNIYAMLIEFPGTATVTTSHVWLIKEGVGSRGRVTASVLTDKLALKANCQNLVWPLDGIRNPAELKAWVRYVFLATRRASFALFGNSKKPFENLHKAIRYMEGDLGGGDEGNIPEMVGPTDLESHVRASQKESHKGTKYAIVSKPSPSKDRLVTPRSPTTERASSDSLEPLQSELNGVSTYIATDGTPATPLKNANGKRPATDDLLSPSHSLKQSPMRLLIELQKKQERDDAMCAKVIRTYSTLKKRRVEREEQASLIMKDRPKLSRYHNAIEIYDSEGGETDLVEGTEAGRVVSKGVDDEVVETVVLGKGDKRAEYGEEGTVDNRQEVVDHEGGRDMISRYGGNGGSLFG